MVTLFFCNTYLCRDHLAEEGIKAYVIYYASYAWYVLHTSKYVKKKTMTTRVVLALACVKKEAMPKRWRATGAKQTKQTNPPQNTRRGEIQTSHLLPSPSYSLPPSRNSDPGSHSRLLSPSTHYGSCHAFFIARIFQLFPRRLASNFCEHY